LLAAQISSALLGGDSYGSISSGGEVQEAVR
jgi:hypothetical protein